MGRRIALISISVGIVLAAAKIVVGSKAGSNAVVSDGIEASGDVLSSAIVYAGLWLASKPPDAEHPYGHGRYETLAGLAVGAMLLLSGAAILWHGLTSLHEVSNVRAYAMYPLFAAVLAKIGLASAKFRVGKKIDSSGLQADAWHDLTDLLSTSVALIAVVLTLISPARLGSADQGGRRAYRHYHSVPVRSGGSPNYRFAAGHNARAAEIEADLRYCLKRSGQPRYRKVSGPADRLEVSRRPSS